MNQSAPVMQASKNITWILVGLSIAIGFFGVALFTELGQLLNMPSAWLYVIHPNLSWISLLLFIAAFYVLYQHIRNKFMTRRLIITYE
ncbi:MAG: hypothetical protein OQL19_19360 [Gammaproteobacteria bacterium]|nr:hypothetical protein [Gammaproteobacteria bacterium]